MKRAIYTVALLAIASCLSFSGNAPSLAQQNQQARISDDSILNKNTIDDWRAVRLRELMVERASGVPFAMHEIEILDAFEAGLLISRIEADAVIARVIYDA